MKSIKGLMLKDLLNLSHYYKTFIATLIVFSIVSITSLNMGSFLPGMITMMVGMIALSTFSYDEVGRTDKFILTLPTNRKEIVSAKYILIISLTILGAILAFIINFFISSLIFHQIPNLIQTLLVVLSCFFAVALIECIQIPSIYKWGSEKGKIQMFLIFAFIMLVGVGIYLITKNMHINIDFVFLKNISFSFIALFIMLITVIMYFISYKIAIKIYTKKEI